MDFLFTALKRLILWQGSYNVSRLYLDTRMSFCID